MFFYILPFFIVLLVGLYINKIREEKEGNKNNKNYQSQFLIYSLIAILSIIYIQLLFSDIFISFLKNYTSFAYKLEGFKLYFFPKGFSKPTEKNIKMLGGAKENIKVRDYIVNNDLPLSDSDISSIISY